MSSPHDVPPRHDQRRYLRVPVRVEVCVDSQAVRGDYAINLSTTGICLQSSEPQTPGTIERLRFCLPPETEWIEVEAEVMWCTRDADRAPGMAYYEVGLRFLEVPPDSQDVLATFVSRNVTGAGEASEPSGHSPGPSR